MTDPRGTFTRQLSDPTIRQDLPPQLPAHGHAHGSDGSPSPQPPKTVQRAKTMKPGIDKVRGLFKKKEAGDMVRESRSMSTSAHGDERPTGHFLFEEDLPDRPGSQAKSRQPHHHHHHHHHFQDDIRQSTIRLSDTQHITMTTVLPGDNERIDMLLESLAHEQLSPEAEEARRQLLQLKESIQREENEIGNLLEEKNAIMKHFDELQRQIQQQENEHSQIEHQFFKHTRTIRATDDDLSTIRDAFKLLKYSISRMTMSLNKKSDPQAAIAKFTQIWPTLQIVDEHGQLEPFYINLLAEKLVHQHLVTRVFQSPVVPGLEINDAYKSMNAWLSTHRDAASAVRLRQQVASIVAKNPALTTGAQEKTRLAETIYNDLADIYHPFLRDHDDAVDQDKGYRHKIHEIVEKAIKLTLAIRGQDVDIATLETTEGKDVFDQETMVDVKGRTSGTVRFCICPPFKGGDGEHGFMEKGKVVLNQV